MDHAPVCSDARTSASRPTGSDGPSWANPRASAQALRAAQARRSSGRRRHVDPTTCDRDYSDAELEFMRAMQDYKQQSGRMFPTWSEVLEVLRNLGYEKTYSPQATPPDPNPSPNPSAAATPDKPRSQKPSAKPRRAAEP